MYRPKKKGRDLLQKRAAWGWLFVLPFLLGFLVFVLSPLYTSFMFSVHEMSSTKGDIVYPGLSVEESSRVQPITYVGLKYYDKAFNENLNYVTSLTSTAAQMTNIIYVLIFSFLVANVLNQQFRGRALARAIFFLPVITATGAASAMGSGWGSQYIRSDMNSATSQMGIITQIEEAVKSLQIEGFGSIISDAFTQLNSIVLLSGVQILIFLAALQTISPSLFEASDIEGATKWESFWKITFPMVSPMILVNAMYTAIDYFTNKNNPVMAYLFRQSGSTSVTLVLSMGWAYFLAVAVIVFGLSALVSRFVYYENQN